MRLSSEQARVLGSLIEKQMTTPLSYPLTLNSLVTACNQKSNRSPVVSYDHDTVLRAVDQLRDLKLIDTVFPDGSRVAKYKHNATYEFGLNGRLQAILCVLLLRGPQTAGEIRTRTDRMARFDNIQHLTENIHELITREEGALIVVLPPGSGQKEQRYMHTLCGASAPRDFVPQEPTDDIPDVSVPSSPETGALIGRIEKLEEEVATLRATVAAWADDSPGEAADSTE